MSSRENRGLAAEIFDEDGVARFLAEHPDFFESHAGLLEKLRLPHRTGPAVSLVERQVSVLQDKNRKLERRLRELVDVARANTDLSGKVHALAMRLLGAADAESVFAALESGLREDFGASRTVAVLLHDASEIVPGKSTRFLRWVDRNDPALKAFTTFVQLGRPRCGRVRDVQRNFLFPAEAEGIASVALVPLGPDCELGILAIGSEDSARFNPAMSTDFLARIGELASAALATARRRAASPVPPP